MLRGEKRKRRSNRLLSEEIASRACSDIALSGYPDTALAFNRRQQPEMSQ